MALTGTAKTPRKTGQPQKRGGELKAILDQLDQEWTTLKQDAPQDHGPDEAALLAYYHCCLRPALHWIDGDPYGVEFADEYQGERLAGLCRWLRGLQEAERGPVKVAREQMVQTLRQCWPAYRDLACPQMPEDTSPLELEVLPFTWAAIETLWQGQTWVGDGPAQFLPQFRYQETANFHLTALAVLFLNRQLRYYLTDLHPHPTDVAGRN